MKLFVSYARVDKPYCVQIVDTLDIHEVWVDQRLAAGQNWWKEILRRLDWCEGFIYLLSPDSVNSEYCRREFELALSLGRPIFPILIREGTVIPDALKQIQYVDFTRGITMESLKMLLNSIQLEERAIQERSARPVSSIPSEEIRQPTINPATVIRIAATAMENRQYDQAVYLLKQAKASGFSSRFINIDLLLEEAERELANQTIQIEADREYKQIGELLRHPRTARLGWEFFLRFQKIYPDYDPENYRVIYVPNGNRPVTNNRPRSGSGSGGGNSGRPPVPAYTFNVPLLEWCTIPQGWVEVIEVNSVGKRVKRRVELPEFQISLYPVTNSQYNMFLNDPSGYANVAWWQYSALAHQWRSKNSEPKPGKFKGDDHPREMVSWYDATAYGHWLSAQLGYSVTLPTIAQWQRAFQGDDGRPYPWGKNFDPARCNTSESGFNQTTSVRRYPNGASPFGVMDMAGNTWEWCADAIPSPDGKPKRIMRGGSYISPGERAHISFRYELGPESYHNSIGFRIVRNG